MSRYAVRVENYGHLILERPCDDLGVAASLRRQLADDPKNARFTVEIYRPENIDLGCPTGLTRDEQDELEEMCS